MRTLRPRYILCLDHDHRNNTQWNRDLWSWGRPQHEERFRKKSLDWNTGIISKMRGKEHESSNMGRDAESLSARRQKQKYLKEALVSRENEGPRSSDSYFLPRVLRLFLNRDSQSDSTARANDNHGGRWPSSLHVLGAVLSIPCTFSHWTLSIGAPSWPP